MAPPAGVGATTPSSADFEYCSRDGIICAPAGDGSAVPTLRTLAPGLTVLALMLFAAPTISSGQSAKRSSSASRVTKPADATAAARRRFLDMFVRANFPGR